MADGTPLAVVWKGVIGAGWWKQAGRGLPCHVDEVRGLVRGLARGLVRGLVRGLARGRRRNDYLTFQRDSGLIGAVSGPL